MCAPEALKPQRLQPALEGCSLKLKPNVTVSIPYSCPLLGWLVSCVAPTCQNTHTQARTLSHYVTS